MPVPAAQAVSLNASFVLPTDAVGHGSALVFNGLRWTADVRVNGREQPQVTGGPGRTEVPLGDALRPGKNSIEVDLRGPQNAPILLTGEAGENVSLADAPTLELRPLSHIASATARLTDKGLTATASVKDAPANATVTFEAWQDGTLLSTLGESTVHNNVATLGPTPWSGPVWGIDSGGSALFHLVTRLFDERGKALDVRTQRTGVRSLSLGPNGALLNGESVRLVGIRDLPDGLLASARVLAPAGLNLVEFHGDVPSPQTLSIADELGVPLAIMARCDGRIRATADALAQHADAMAGQDDGILALTGNSPAVLVWSTEGNGINQKNNSIGQALVSAMTRDPVDRIVAAIDLPAFAMPAAGDDDRSQTLRSEAGHTPGQPFWLLEFYLNQDGSRPAEHRIGETLANAMTLGAMGAVLPGSKRGDAEWSIGWAERTRSLGLQPLQPNGKRAEARLIVRGLTAGTTATVSAPGTPTQRVVADPMGEAHFAVWHRGQVTVSHGAQQRTVKLTPGQWQDYEWAGQPTVIAWD